MTDKIKLVIWGLGRHANKRILPAIENSKSVELSGIYTRNQTLGKEEAKKRGCRYFFSSDEMLSDPNIQAVFLCTPTGLHFSQGKSVLQAGKHLWSEKTLTTSSAHSLQLVELARDRDIFVGEAYMHKYHEQFRRLKEIVEDKHLGRLMRLICRFSIPVLDQPGFRSIPNLGASALLDVGSYTFSMADELFSGAPNFDFAEHQMGANGIDRSGICVLGYEGGSKAVLDWSYDSCYVNQIELWFERGTVFTDKIFSKADDYKPVLQIRSLNGTIETEELPAENCYVNMLNHFAYCSTPSTANDFKTILSTSQLISTFAEKVGMPEIGWQSTTINNN